MDGAMQDLSTLGSRLQLALLRDWPKLALWRGLPAGASLVGAYRQLSFSFSFSFSHQKVFSSSSLAIF